MPGIDFAALEERLITIISLQTGIIDELFLQLAQHISVEEAESLPCVEKISEVCAIRRELGIADCGTSCETAQDRF